MQIIQSRMVACYGMQAVVSPAVTTVRLSRSGRCRDGGRPCPSRRSRRRRTGRCEWWRGPRIRLRPARRSRAPASPGWSLGGRSARRTAPTGPARARPCDPPQPHLVRLASEPANPLAVSRASRPVRNSQRDAQPEADTAPCRTGQLNALWPHTPRSPPCVLSQDYLSVYARCSLRDDWTS